MAVTSTRVFAVMRQLKELLDSQAWPVHPLSGERPVVAFGGLVSEKTREPIVILGVPEDNPQIDFAGLSLVSMDELFVIRVQFSTLVPGVWDGETVYTRLEELVAVLEVALRDQTNGRPIGGFGLTDTAGCGGIWWRVAGVLPSLDLVDKHGVIGECPVDIAFRVRI